MLAVTAAALPDELVAPPLLSLPEPAPDEPLRLFDLLLLFFFRFKFMVGVGLTSSSPLFVLLVSELGGLLSCFKLPEPPDTELFLSPSRLSALHRESNEPVALFPSVLRLPLLAPLPAPWGSFPPSLLWEPILEELLTMATTLVPGDLYAILSGSTHATAAGMANLTEAPPLEELALARLLVCCSAAGADAAEAGVGLDLFTTPPAVMAAGILPPQPIDVGGICCH